MVRDMISINQYYEEKSGVKALVVCDSNVDQFGINCGVIMLHEYYLCIGESLATK